MKVLFDSQIFDIQKFGGASRCFCELIKSFPSDIIAQISIMINCNIHLRNFAELVAKVCSTKVVFDLPTNAEKQGFSGSSIALLDNSRLLHLGWKPNYKMEDAVLRTLEILL